MGATRSAAALRHQLVVPQPGRLAIFDLDRTLVPGASVVPLLRALVEDGHISRRRLARAGAEHALYRHRGSSDAQVERVRRHALAVVAGLERAPLLEVADRVARRLVAGVKPGARLLVDRHLAAGDFCVLLSASPHELVEAVGRRLGLHRSIGTRAAARDGVLTGEIDGLLCYGAAKLEALRLALGEVDTIEAAAYADSASDLPVLEACGHPVAVNPDRVLRRIAVERGWPVLTLG